MSDFKNMNFGDDDYWGNQYNEILPKYRTLVELAKATEVLLDNETADTTQLKLYMRYLLKQFKNCLNEVEKVECQK